VRVSTPTLELHGATDEPSDQLAEVVRAGTTRADPGPYDDPMSFYKPDPDLRVAKWLRAICWAETGSRPMPSPGRADRVQPCEPSAA